MPFNDPPPLPGMASILQDVLRRLGDIEAKMTNLQNASIVATDTAGKTRMVIGALGAGVWGIQFYDASGNLLTQQDSAGLKQYDSAGHLLTQIDATGMKQYDTSANLRAALGNLGLGDYGLRVVDGANVANEVLPAYNSVWLGSNSTASTTPVTLANSPTVTAWLGSSGDCDITISALLNPGGVNQALVYLTLDGVQVSGSPILNLVSNTTAPTAASCATTIRLSSWKGSPASGGAQHVFGLKYASAVGTITVNFSNVSIVVNPI